MKSFLLLQFCQGLFFDDLGVFLKVSDRVMPYLHDFLHKVGAFGHGFLSDSAELDDVEGLWDSSVARE